MKKSFALLLVVCMLVTMAACATNGKKPQDTSATSVTGETGEKLPLTIWYWGEQDNPGVKAWMEEAVRQYSAKTGIKVEAVLQETDSLYSAFRTAEAAKAAPDIQYLWGGTLALEDVWMGHLAPVDDYFTKEELSKFTPDSLAETNWDGRQWGIPTYQVCTGFAYNKDMFREAGLDAEHPYTTWDEFVTCCEALKAAGFTPLGAGLKNGFFAGWLAFNMAQQNLDSRQDLLPFLEGTESYAEEKYSEYLVKFLDLVNKGYVNNDIMSLDNQQGQQLLENNQAAMVMMSSNYAANLEKTLGKDKIGIMRPPIYGTGALKDTFAAFCDAWVIPKSAKNKEGAADFLRFIQTPDMLKLLYDESSCIVPHSDFNDSWLSTDIHRNVNNWFKDHRGLTYQFFYPPAWEYDGLSPAVQMIVSGEMTVEEACKMMDEAMAQWRTQSPDQMDAFRKY